MQLNTNDVLLFSGDSITDGARGHNMDCNHIFGHGYQTIIAGQLALDNAEWRPKFINKGYSGFTMSQLEAQWQKDVIAFCPTIVSLLAGVNDGCFGFQEGFSPRYIADRYETALQSALDKTFDSLGKIQFIILEPFYFPLDRSDCSYRYTPHPDCEPPFSRPDTDESEESIAHRQQSMPLIQAAAKKCAEQNGCVFVPLQKPFQEIISRTRTEYLIWDGTHPTIAGHTLIAREWLRAVL